MSGPAGGSSPAARAARRTAATASAAVAGARPDLAQMPEIRGQTRIVKRPAVEPGGELTESRGVDAAGVRRGGPRDELGRGLGAGAVRGREARSKRSRTSSTRLVSDAVSLAGID